DEACSSGDQNAHHPSVLAVLLRVALAIIRGLRNCVRARASEAGGRWQIIGLALMPSASRDKALNSKFAHGSRWQDGAALPVVLVRRVPFSLRMAELKVVYRFRASLRSLYLRSPSERSRTGPSPRRGGACQPGRDVRLPRRFRDRISGR